MDSLERELREETGKSNLPGVMLAVANRDGMPRDIVFISDRNAASFHCVLIRISHPTDANGSPGTFDYIKYFGNASLKPDAKPVSAATTFCIASSTKLATSVAAMQCVERGLIGLEDDVSVVLPELKDAQIFTGIVDGKPALKKAQNTITLR